MHINLIKLNEVPPDKNRPNDIKYFVELEVIEGTDKTKGVFAYYYGYIYLEKKMRVYKIKDMNYHPKIIYVLLIMDGHGMQNLLLKLNMVDGAHLVMEKLL